MPNIVKQKRRNLTFSWVNNDKMMKNKQNKFNFWIDSDTLILNFTKHKIYEYVVNISLFKLKV